MPRSDKEKGLKTVFFGGDQLTEERARNVQMAIDKTEEQRKKDLRDCGQRMRIGMPSGLHMM